MCFPFVPSDAESLGLKESGHNRLRIVRAAPKNLGHLKGSVKTTALRCAGIPMFRSGSHTDTLEQKNRPAPVES